MNILQTITVLISSIAAVLAWLAKLKWAKEFTNAKNEIIKAKDAQIDVLNQQVKSLQELTPMRIREYFLSVRVQLEEYNESLKKKLEEALQEIDKKDSELKSIRLKGDSDQMVIKKLEKERNDLYNFSKELNERLYYPIKYTYKGNDVNVLNLVGETIKNELFSQSSLSTMKTISFIINNIDNIWEGLKFEKVKLPETPGTAPLPAAPQRK